MRKPERRESLDIDEGLVECLPTPQEVQEQEACDAEYEQIRNDYHMMSLMDEEDYRMRSDDDSYCEDFGDDYFGDDYHLRCIPEELDGLYSLHKAEEPEKFFSEKDEFVGN